MLAFIHIQKTAGITVKWMLRSTFGMRHCDVEPWHAEITPDPFSADDLSRLIRFYPDLRSVAGHRVVPYAALETVRPDVRYFALVREPLARCASWFQHLVCARGRTHLDFEEYMQTAWPRNRQTQMLAGVDDAGEAIHVIREKRVFVGLVECFDESMLMLKRLVGPELDIGYGRRNVASDNELAQSLLSTRRTREILVEANREDLKLYEYVVNELYPDYRQAYGDQLPADLAQYQSARGTFNVVNINLSRLKLFLLYRPLLWLYRRGVCV